MVKAALQGDTVAELIGPVRWPLVIGLVLAAVTVTTFVIQTFSMRQELGDVKYLVCRIPENRYDSKCQGVVVQQQRADR